MAEQDQVFRSNLPFPFALESVHVVSDPTSTGRHSHCLICLDPFNASSTIVVHSLPCNVAFHKRCLQDWLTQGLNADNVPGCPSCRGPLRLILSPLQEILKHKYTQHSTWLGRDAAHFAEEIVNSLRIDTSKLGTFFDDLTALPAHALLRNRANLSWTTLIEDVHHTVTDVLEQELQSQFSAHLFHNYSKLITSSGANSCSQQPWAEFCVREIADELFDRVADLVGQVAHEVASYRMMLAISKQLRTDIQSKTGTGDKFADDRAVNSAFDAFAYARRCIFNNLVIHLRNAASASLSRPLQSIPTPRAWRAWRTFYQCDNQHPPRRASRYWSQNNSVLVSMRRRPWCLGYVI